MKKYLLSLFFFPALIFAQSSDYKIDENATQVAPLKTEDIITKVNLTFSDIHSGMQHGLNARGMGAYRVFLGVTDQGGYLVQDFYQICTEDEKIAHSLPSKKNAKPYKCQGDVKMTAPFVLAQPMESMGTDTLINSFDYYGLKFSEGCVASTLFPPFYKSISGEFTLWYPNGQKSLEGTFKNGLPEGIWKTWYNEGSQRTQVSYTNGLANGLTTIWDEDGKKSTKYENKEGKLHGFHIIQWANGAKEERHYENDRMNGVNKKWNKDGKLIEETQYKDGKLVTETKTAKNDNSKSCEPLVKDENITFGKNRFVACYTDDNYSMSYAQREKDHICRFVVGQSKNGNDIMQDFYVDEYTENQAPTMKPTDPNVLKYSDPFEVIAFKRRNLSENLFDLADQRSELFAGPIKIWYPDGTPKLAGNYDSTGKKQGTWARWHGNGHKDYEIEYLDGSRHRKVIFREEDGSKYKETLAINGKHYGQERTWCNNDTLRSESQWVGNQLHGPATYWHCNGQKSSEGFMSDGYKTGIWKEWNEEGVQIQEFDYSSIPVELQHSR